MPKGVEHKDRTEGVVQSLEVKKAVMPKGVEHRVRSGMGVTYHSREEGRDAERR